MTGTFGARLMAFYDSLEKFRWVTPDVGLLSPVADAERRDAMAAFCRKFYGDDASRVFWLGINPSRVRRTSSGVPYTDGYALSNYCKISNEFDQRRELTSDFFYRFINAYGGPANFYRRHYCGAAFPLSILKKDKYCNYYDRELPRELVESIPSMVVRQSEIGNLGVLVIIGSGQNASVLQRLNNETGLFKHVLVVEHPRYIMQYRSARLDQFIQKFCATAAEAERLAAV